MQVSVESLSQIERRFTIVVPAERYEEAYQKKLDKIAKTAKIKGFSRPGKVPLSYIKERYGAAAQQEALKDVINDSFTAALSTEKLSPVGLPHLDVKTHDLGASIEYSATFEVMPQIEAVHFNVDQIEKEVADVADNDINTVIERLRTQHRTWQEVQRPAQANDQVIIDFAGSINQVPFKGGQAHDYPLVLGSQSMLPGFEEGLIGISARGETSIEIDFPNDYHAQDLAGKKAVFALKVHKVSAPELPIIDESFIKNLDVKSGQLSDLQAEIKGILQRELDLAIKNKLKTQVFNQLLSQNALAIPKALIEREVARIHDQRCSHASDPQHKHSAHNHSEEEMLALNQLAQRNIALGLLLSQYATQHHLSVDSGKVEARIVELAGSYQNPAEVIKMYQTKKSKRANIEDEIFEEQILENLLASTKLVEKKVNFNEIVSGSRLLG